MNTIVVMIFLNLFFMFSRWNVAASENEESFESAGIQEIGFSATDNIVTEYYEEGHYQGFVKEQFCLIENEDPVLISRYEYKPHEMVMFDAFDNKTVYKENDFQELSTIEKYDAEGGLISKERFFLEDSKLILKQLEDANGNVLVCERYFYTSSGELIEKKMYSDVYELAQKIENNVLPVNEMFAYLNELLSGHGFSSIQELAESYFGPLYLVMAGYYNHPLEAGVFGFGEANDKVRITFINGILNRNRDCMETAHLISKTHGGINIHYIYRPTVGWANDLMGAVPVRFGSVTPQATLLANTWKELIAEMGGVDSGGVIIHYAHSIGASDTWNARTLLSPEEKSMIRVVTIGSPFMIHKDGLHSVVNYVSVRDGVSMLDPFGYFRGHYDEDSNVVFLSSWREGLPIIDHPIYGSTYEALLHKLGADFVSTYGSVQ
jgi:hypothetical protein